jgi:hypothetical protein
MQNKIEFINYDTIWRKINLLPFSQASHVKKETSDHFNDNTKVTPKQPKSVSATVNPQDIYSFGDNKLEITMHNNVTPTGDITHNAIINFSVTIKSEGIIPKQKTVCEREFYFNYAYNQTMIVIGKIKDGIQYECVRIAPITNETICLYSLLYNLPENARKACGQCNGSLYLLIAYYIINFIITKKYIKSNTKSTFSLYDNAVRTSISNNSTTTIKKNNIKLSVEQLIKYNRTYYEAFGFLPHIIYTTNSNNLLKNINNLNKTDYHIIAPTEPNYLVYLEFLVQKRKEILNMKLGAIKQLLNNINANNTILDFFKFKTKTTSTEYLLFVNVDVLKNEIMPNAIDDNTKLNTFLSNYQDIERIHSLFFLPEKVESIVIDKRVIRIYTPQNILESVIQIYNTNGIQIYEPYFRAVKLIQ